MYVYAALGPVGRGLAAACAFAEVIVPINVVVRVYMCKAHLDITIFVRLCIYVFSRCMNVHR